MLKGSILGCLVHTESVCWKKTCSQSSVSHQSRPNTCYKPNQNTQEIEFSADPLLGQSNCSDTVLSNQHSSLITSYTHTSCSDHL